MINNYLKRINIELSKDNHVVNYVSKDRLYNEMSNALPNQFLMFDYIDRSEKPKIDDKIIDKSLFYYDSNAIFQLDVLTTPNNNSIEISNERIKVFQSENAVVKSFKLFKMIYNDLKNSFAYLLASDKEIYMNNLLKDSNIQKIFEINQPEITIKDIFFPQCEYKTKIIYVLLSNNHLLKLNYTKQTNNNSIILNVLLNPNEIESTKKEKDSNNIQIIDYTVTQINYTKESKVFFSHEIFTFHNVVDTNIEISYFFNSKGIKGYETKLLTIYKNLFIALALNNGTVYLLNLLQNPNQVVAIYKSSYGSCTSLSFSKDGGLLGISTEDNNAYIIDIPSKKVIACLTGHHNYITNILFELQIKPGLKHRTSTTSNLLSIQKDSTAKPKTKFISREPKSIVDQWAEELTKIAKDVDIHNIYSTNTIKKNEPVSSKVYDIYTSGQDGFICSFRVENCDSELNPFGRVVQNEGACEEEDQKNIPTSRGNQESKMLERANVVPVEIEYCGLQLLNENDDNYDTIIPCFINKVYKQPIVFFYKDEKSICVIGKKNSLGNSVKCDILVKEVIEEKKEEEKKKEERKEVRHKMKSNINKKLIIETPSRLPKKFSEISRLAENLNRTGVVIENSKNYTTCFISPSEILI